MEKKEIKEKRTITVSPSTWLKIQNQADNLQTSASWLVGHILREWLDNKLKT